MHHHLADINTLLPKEKEEALQLFHIYSAKHLIGGPQNLNHMLLSQYDFMRVSSSLAPACR